MLLHSEHKNYQYKNSFYTFIKQILIYFCKCTNLPRDLKITRNLYLISKHKVYGRKFTNWTTFSLHLSYFPNSNRDFQQMYLTEFCFIVGSLWWVVFELYFVFWLRYNISNNILPHELHTIRHLNHKENFIYLNADC